MENTQHQINLKMENLPAYLNLFLWQLKSENRLRTKDGFENLTFLFILHDLPPACLLKIENEDYTIDLMTNECAFQFLEENSKKIDSYIIGNAKTILHVDWNILELIKELFLGRLKIKGIKGWLKLTKILSFNGSIQEE